LFEDLENLGANDQSLQVIRSYLEKRKAHVTIESLTASCVPGKGCPQGSQLGPILWNVSMNQVLKVQTTVKTKLVADDLAIAVAAMRLPIAKERISLILDRLIKWAETRDLDFSSKKTQVITLKGGLKPGYNITFGNDIKNNIK